MAKTAEPTTVINSTPTHDEIAAHAYQIYLREGCVEGRDMDHWLQAEAELRLRSANDNGHPVETSSANRPQRSARNAKTESAASILPNSVVPPTAPIAEVTRSTAPRRNAPKREAAAAK